MTRNNYRGHTQCTGFEAKTPPKESMKNHPFIHIELWWRRTNPCKKCLVQASCYKYDSDYGDNFACKEIEKYAYYLKKGLPITFSVIIPLFTFFFIVAILQLVTL